MKDAFRAYHGSNGSLPMKRETITIYDLAREAGVSPATVSRVLNNSARVKKEKRDRVMQLVEKYRFIPNAVAQGLSKSNTKTIGVLLSDVRNPFYSTLYVGIETAAIACGYNVILCDALNDPDIECQHLEMLESKNVDVFLLLGGGADDMPPRPEYSALVKRITQKTPVIFASSHNSFDACRLLMNDLPGIEALMAYLLGLGHKKFVLLGGLPSIAPTYTKIQTISSILKRSGLQQDDGWVVETPHYEVDDGYQAAKKLFKRPLRELPTAIIGVNEMITLGVMRAAEEAGLRIPEDISVAGFDNTFLSKICTPSLTCVGCMYDIYGEKLMELVQKLAADPAHREVAMVPCGLTVRRSCGQAAKR